MRGRGAGISSIALTLVSLLSQGRRGVEPSNVEVHPDGLRLGEILDRGRAVLAAKTGVALATPGQPHIGIAIGVDPDRAGAGFLGKTLHPSDVAAPDTCGQTIRGAIRYPPVVSSAPSLSPIAT